MGSYSDLEKEEKLSSHAREPDWPVAAPVFLYNIRFNKAIKNNLLDLQNVSTDYGRYFYKSRYYFFSWVSPLCTVLPLLMCTMF